MAFSLSQSFEDFHNKIHSYSPEKTALVIAFSAALGIGILTYFTGDAQIRIERPPSKKPNQMPKPERERIRDNHNDVLDGGSIKISGSKSGEIIIRNPSLDAPKKVRAMQRMLIQELLIKKREEGLSPAEVKQLENLKRMLRQD